MLHAQDEFSENLAHIVIKVSEIKQTDIFAGVLVLCFSYCGFCACIKTNLTWFKKSYNNHPLA